MKELPFLMGSFFDMCNKNQWKYSVVILKGFDEMQITEQIITECLNELQLAALAKQKYADYYNGQHAILKNYAMQESPKQSKAHFQFPS
ncbi:hypothetical protein [Paenibacillus terrae]|uniref:hypothetical protein n=1 Tax=Paenibacillus terrae TaxID=159743 RepID=UPI001F37B444|nr:hypothetical protein [Paenibacillus terrae]